MKVFAATSETQGWRDNDYCCTIEGELVIFPRSSVIAGPSTMNAAVVEVWPV
jgi:hypothetical protein